MSSRLLTLLLLLLAIHETQCIMGILGIPPEQTLVTDIDHQVLVHDVAPILKTTYLSIFSGEIETQFNGIIFGRGMRALTNLPLSLAYKSCPISINVIFKIDTGAPISTLTAEVVQKLIQNCPKIQHIISGLFAVNIAGHQIKVSKSKAHYQTLNILGADFLSQTNSRLEFNYSRKRIGHFKLQIAGSWIKDQQEEL